MLGEGSAHALEASDLDVAHLAYHDALTGLPNRTLLGERLTEALIRARSSGRAVALLYVDLDDFKLVNDSLGHLAGDELLRRVAVRLAGVVREGDTLARQGGDEFLVLLAGLLPQQAHAAAERVGREIAAAMEDAFTIGGAEFQIGPSVGISVFPELADNAEALHKQADAAMYRAKEAGGGFAFFEPTAENPLARLSLAARMRKALDNREFELHFQPIFSLANGPVVRGVEALLRWNDPDRGMVAPAEFIPVAERTGVIDAIGTWVIDETCRQAREWLDIGLEPNIGCNVSPRQLRQPAFADRLARALAAYDLDPSHFVVEITESGWMLDADRALPVLEDVHRAGATLAIDDFGAGYSTLARLRALPAQIIKIDRAFLAGLPDDPQAAAIVSAIVQLATACNCDVVAEGIETPQQLDFLIDQGCGFGQGFHLARPMPVSQLTPLLAAGLDTERRRV